MIKFDPFMMFAVFVVGVIVLVTVVRLALAAFRWIRDVDKEEAEPPQAISGVPPLDILKERFARGEIDKEEFEERRRVLE